MPARARDLIRVLRKLGLTVEQPKKGSHWKVTDGKMTYPIPMHNAEQTELDDVYVRGVCRAFGLDEGALRKKL